MKILAVVNQKGGVGKTTTAVTIAHGLALRKYNTLLVDLDAQGNVADCLGLPAGNDLYSALLPPKKAAKPLQSGRENLHVLRSDETTTALKISLAGVSMREYVLEDLIEKIGAEVVVFDCAPSIDVLHTAAMVAAHYLVIPTRLDQLAVKGVRDVLKSLKEISRITSCELGAIIPTFFDRQTNETYIQLKNLVKTFKDQVWSPIPQDVACRESTRFGQTLWEYAPTTRAVVGYPDEDRKLVGGYKEILDRVEEKLL